jgi:hypothetical protein
VRSLVVVESVFGNPRQIAEAIGQGLSGRSEVRVVDVADAPADPQGFDLLVVGGPTHAFGMTRPSTRRSAADQAGGSITAAETGLREWLDALPPGTAGAAAFDTRMVRPRTPGASRGAAKRLRRRGFRLVAKPETFRVTDSQGPLKDGEIERATAWGEALASQIAGQESVGRTGG